MIEDSLILPTEPYAEISESNSLVYILQEDIDNKYTYENNFNTLSINRSSQISTSGIQFFRNYNIPFTQFRTNYTNISIKEYADDVLVDVPYVKIRQNIALTDGYDCKLVELVDGKLGIYFDSGNQYDYETEKIIDVHVLNGFLPSFCKVGNYVDLGVLGIHQIESLGVEDIYDVAVIDTEAIDLYINKADIIFNSSEDLTDGDYFSISYDGDVITMTARTTRSINGEFTIGSNDFETASNVYEAMIEDYPSYDYELYYLGEVTIKKTDSSEISFVDVQDDDNILIIINPSDSFVYGDDTVRCYSKYNVEEYDVYAFETDLSSKEETRIGIEFTDDRDMFRDISYISEQVVVDDELEDYLEIAWYNSEDTSDMDYSTKFYGVGHFEYDDIEEIEVSDNETETTDTTVVPISASVYHGVKITFRGMSEMTKRKLSQVFSHDTLFIDRQRVSVYKSFESEKTGTGIKEYDGEVQLLYVERYDPLKYEGIIGDRAIVLEGLLDGTLDIEL